jgi:hypothetical protein
MKTTPSPNDIQATDSRGLPAPPGSAPLTHPVQTHYEPSRQAVVPQVVTMRAYEVYCHLYGPQEAMVTGWCRGGFAVSELIAFLDAHTFPKDEWRTRADEAFRGMKGL